jgi:hypothetical protein
MDFVLVGMLNESIETTIQKLSRYAGLGFYASFAFTSTVRPILVKMILNIGGLFLYQRKKLDCIKF